jgi:hypothetical protein
MQRYLIDGHNLIPKIPGLSLRQIDDELRLIELLQVYARVKRCAIEVFFDDAPPGLAGARSYGTVRAHFSPLASSADAAIRSRLAKSGKNTQGLHVVSSDRQVLAEARARGAALITAETFADQLLAAQNAPSPVQPSNRRGARPPAETPGLSAAEVDEWLKVFQNKKKG